MATYFSRRSFARLLAGAATALSTPGLSHAASGRAGAVGAANDLEDAASGRSFPAGFLWGSATASYQVEGAVHEDGRGPSIWDTFSHTPDKTFHGDTGDVADDFFHRYKGDIEIMKQLGLKSFRFSVAWPRIFPQGTGKPNPQGMDFYNRLVDALLAAGIQPFCTLYHWDLPQALQDKGGWQNPATAKAFADYAGYTAARLSDRVRHFMTMNEIRSFTEGGYREGHKAPGLRLGPREVAQVNHYAVLGHGLAVQAIRAQARPGTKIGLASNPTATVPVYDAPEQVEAARRAMRELNAPYLTVIQEGRYTDLYLKRLGANAPVFTAEEMKIISSPMDFVGINCYEPAYVRADDSEAGFTVVPWPESYPAMASGWLKVGPEALYWSPRLVHELWKVNELYITENGTSSADRIAPDGHVYDTDRVMYLRNYLTQLQRAVAEGIPVKGYFLWSLLDNYEWSDGYSKRFGIVYVDFASQKRTPKLSAAFYRRTVEENRVA